MRDVVLIILRILRLLHKIRPITALFEVSRLRVRGTIAHVVIARVACFMHGVIT